MGRSRDVSSMPWMERETLCFWAYCSVGVSSCPAPPRRPAVRPNPTRSWYVRVLDSIVFKLKDKSEDPDFKRAEGSWRHRDGGRRSTREGDSSSILPTKKVEMEADSSFFGEKGERLGEFSDLRNRRSTIEDRICSILPQESKKEQILRFSGSKNNELQEVV